MTHQLEWTESSHGVSADGYLVSKHFTYDGWRASRGGMVIIDRTTREHAIQAAEDHYAVHGPLACPFPDLREKRQSEMGAAERQDAQEQWVRDQILSFPPYHQNHVRRLLRRLDQLRERIEALEGEKTYASVTIPLGQTR